MERRQSGYPWWRRLAGLVASNQTIAELKPAWASVLLFGVLLTVEHAHGLLFALMGWYDPSSAAVHVCVLAALVTLCLVAACMSRPPHEGGRMLWVLMMMGYAAEVAIDLLLPSPDCSTHHGRQRFVCYLAPLLFVLLGDLPAAAALLLMMATVLLGLAVPACVGPQGNVLYLVAGVLMVVKVRKMQNAQLAWIDRLRAEAAAQSREAQATVGQGLYHELRLPTALLGSAVDWLQAQPGLGEGVTETVLALSSQTGVLQGLLRDVLAMAGLEGDGAPDAPRSAFGLHALHAGLRADLTKVIQQKQLSVAFEIDQSIPAHMVADKARLRQALSTLCLACARLSQAQAKLLVSWSLERPTAHGLVAKLAVTDAAMVLSAEEQAKLHEQAAGPSGGACTPPNPHFGLALLRRLAAPLGPRDGERVVGVDSTPNGTVFWVVVELWSVVEGHPHSSAQSSTSLSPWRTKVLVAPRSPISAGLRAGLSTSPRSDGTSPRPDGDPLERGERPSWPPRPPEAPGGGGGGRAAGLHQSLPDFLPGGRPTIGSPSGTPRGMSTPSRSRRNRNMLSSPLNSFRKAFQDTSDDPIDDPQPGSGSFGPGSPIHRKRRKSLQTQHNAAVAAAMAAAAAEVSAVAGRRLAKESEGEAAQEVVAVQDLDLDALQLALVMNDQLLSSPCTMDPTMEPTMDPVGTHEAGGLLSSAARPLQQAAFQLGPSLLSGAFHHGRMDPGTIDPCTMEEGDAALSSSAGTGSSI